MFANGMFLSVFQLRLSVAMKYVEDSEQGP